MEEQLISNKTSKLAYKKKFNEDSCNYCIVLDKTQNKELKLFYDATSKIHDNFTIIGLLPTQSLLQKWLRYIYGIHIIIIPTVTSFWTHKIVTVISQKDDDIIMGIKSVSDLPPYKEVCGYDFNTFEDALEDALFESLKLI